MAELTKPDQAAPRQVMTVRYQVDRRAAGTLVRETAARLGFVSRETEELVLAALELTSNLLKYAGGGEFVLTETEMDGQPGLQMETLDRGPGFSNIQRAPGDGWTTGHSLGYGLGAVNRFTDHLEINERDDPPGAHVLCRRRLRTAPSADVHIPLTFGAASRPKPGSSVNGDDFFIKTWGNEALAGVIDGLGHGQFAHRAANKALTYLRTHYDQPLEALFQGVGRECVATRGVVMALARFDAARQKMSFASIGNIETRVIGSRSPLNFIVRRGIVGLHQTRPK